MATPGANLINLERVSKAYGVRPLLTHVSLGIQRGDRIGIVGRNGDGKTTLLRVMAGLEPPDEGRVTQNRGLRLGLLGQRDALEDDHTVSEVVLGDLAEHEWAGDARSRDVVAHLLSGVPLNRLVASLSGGERRRVSLAQLLLTDLDVVLLDEPTNHLDIEAVAWLAAHLASRGTTLAVVTHDRWFLDAVATSTWEVHDAAVDSYDGGYAAFVLAKAERTRQSQAAEGRRQNLLRKELAWLRRGAPARTSKPRFRIDAATELIADEPPPRDSVELQRFATTRLGKDVLDLEDATITRGGRDLVNRLTWRIGPGDRIGLVGVNGAGKTSVLSVLSKELPPEQGRLRTGRTVRLASLSQSLDGLDPTERVLASVESSRRVTTVASGRELTASSMLERFGFTGDKLTARIGDLSGGERRRLQLLRLLLDEPNVLLLDEPTNDLDIETLNVVEDYLDSWPGTLIVVSHDRYFLERVCDTVWALLGDGSLVLLPGGVDEYLARRAAVLNGPDLPPAGATLSRLMPVGPGKPDGSAASGRVEHRGSGKSALTGRASSDVRLDAAAERAARKDLARIERQLSKHASKIQAVHGRMAERASDYATLAPLDEKLAGLEAEHVALETKWLEAAERLEPPAS
ncbi:MAG: ABC-F family ATP-binding cassette domain-containing protein [Nocardioidaceae bacterium]